MLSTTVRNRSLMGNLGAPRRMRTMSTQASAKRVVTIFSDSICPWCWVGKRNLDNAIALLPEDKRERFTLRWAPYLLDSETPRTGVTVKDYYTQKYGEAGAMLYLDPSNSLNRAAAAIGLQLNPLRRIVNSIDSHRLVHWAEPSGRQSELVEEIFERPFYDPIARIRASTGYGHDPFGVCFGETRARCVALRREQILDAWQNAC